MSDEKRPNVVIAPVERSFLRHLADANLTRTSAEYGHLKFRLPHPEEGSNYFKILQFIIPLFLFFIV